MSRASATVSRSSSLGALWPISPSGWPIVGLEPVEHPGLCHHHGHHRGGDRRGARGAAAHPGAVRQDGCGAPSIYGGQSTHIPLQVNSAGMIPLIFAVSLIMFPGWWPATFVNAQCQVHRNIAQWVSRACSCELALLLAALFRLGGGLYLFLYGHDLSSADLPEMLRRQGGFIPGIRPGAHTAEYLSNVLRRITLVGALFWGWWLFCPSWFGRWWARTRC
jgi:preprotein translocase subunit SecY